MIHTYKIISPTRISFDHPDAGQIYIIKHVLGPVGLPWFCDGYYYPTPEDAEIGFCTRCNAPDPVHNAIPSDAATATGMYDRDF